ncbi:MAG: hypothetical protein QW707_07150 [Candidatus Bathyarchaeia archaeon]
MGVKYCGFCKRYVTPDSNINWFLAIVLLVLGILPGVVYIVYKVTHKVCPICNSRNWVPPPPEETKKQQ